MKELSEHGDGFEEYYYSKEREPEKEITARDDIIEDDMNLLGYTEQRVDFNTGVAQFKKKPSKPSPDLAYVIGVDLWSGHVHKHTLTAVDGERIEAQQTPFTDEERYLVFKLMDEYDKWERETKND